MSDLRRQTRNIHQKGSYVYAAVEEIHMGLATVRLTGGGARLTNLPIVGGEIQVGQRVIVDYSAGVPPVVRPVAESVQPTVGLGLPEGPEVTSSPRRDHSVRLRLTTTTPVAWDTWTTISWDESEYQTDTFWSSGSNITLPLRGVYVVLVDFSWGPSHDHWDEVHDFTTDPDLIYWVNGLNTNWGYDYEPLRIDVYNTTLDRSIGYYESFPVTSEPSVGRKMQMMAMHYAEAEEVLQIKAYQRTRLSSMDLVPHYEENRFMAPRVTIQWMSDKE